ncbi:hypothetical protein [Variovorax ginsengisoli]|jgi:hypothetical protein|uniref:Uncharacterized protein n=1 Tax=Variovorax ginsengisoli TaxID=363844 RepID=A0ABT8S843_9BURK|nr:hypothetical protein [Variovorax ginsengisoli]MDN8615222.1 hypothetical protein [Variovorax ginsengisoli]MDO1534392.1 hypothetical protein [Variovorax ginsengisoli]
MKVTAPQEAPKAGGGAAYRFWTFLAALGLVGAAMLWLALNAYVALVTRD